MQAAILNGHGATISKTGGTKKARAVAGRGKSGGWRVIFADYAEYDLTVLIWAFLKGVQASLTDKQKQVIRDLKRDLDKEVKARYGKQK